MRAGDRSTTDVAETTADAATDAGAALAGLRRRRIPTRLRAAVSDLLASLRVRILGQFVLLLALALVGSLWITHAILKHRAADEVSGELTHEIQVLERFAEGNDPSTGRPFRDDIRRLFDAFLQGDVPARGESVFTFVDGRPFLLQPRNAPYRLDQDPRLMDRWGSLERREGGSIDTPGGPLDFAAFPLRTGGEVEGVFVIGILRNVAAGGVDTAVGATAVVAAIALVIASFLAWRVVRGILVRVDKVTRTARAISERELGRRIGVSGHDEIARLAQTFDEMLDRLEASFAAQRAFFADASHELRTPITVIGGHLSLLEDDPEDRRQTIALVTDELDRMTRIVGDLLVVAKAERRDFVHLEPTDLTAFTEEVYQKISALAPRRWRLDEIAEGTFMGDRHRLTQALLQLAQNAVQHTTEGDLVALGSAIGEDSVRLWIRDSGPGVAPEDRERIFARFARGPGARRSGGAGLGLSIVTAIATAHEGRIELAGEHGLGATFTIVLPTATARSRRRRG